MLVGVYDAAELFGMSPDAIRNLCHAKGQRFAFRLNPKGKFYIDTRRLADYLERSKKA